MSTLKKFDQELKDTLMKQYPDAWQAVLDYEKVTLERFRLKRIEYARTKSQRMKENPEAF